MEKYRISLHTVSGRDIVLNLPMPEYQKFVECANNDSWFTYFESESLSYAINMDHIVYIHTSKEYSPEEQ